MLSVEKVTLAVDGKILLEDADMQVGDAEKVALTGPSGCGKSTLLRAIIGWQPIQSGTIRLDGVVLNLRNLGRIRREIAYIQQVPVMGAATGRDVLLEPFQFHANRHLARPTDAQLAAILAKVNLPADALTQATATMSGGEQQRLSIARSLLVEKKFFLADEVTSALDSDNRDRVIQLFRELPQPILAVVHDEDLINLHTRVYEFQDRKLVEVVKPGGPDHADS